MPALAPLVPIAGKAALALGKGGLTKAATRSFVSGAAFQAGAELIAQIAEWARSIGGDWDSNAPAPGQNVGSANGCWKMESGTAIYEENTEQNLDVLRPPTGAVCNVLSCTASIVESIPDTNQIIVDLSRTYSDKPPQTTRIQRFIGWKWQLNPACGNGVCSDEPIPDDEWDPLDLGDFVSDNCTINVNFMGFLGNPDGTGIAQPVFVMRPGAGLRASGGVIVGDCNFQPTVVVGGGGDGNEPPRTFPMPPEDPGSDDWWANVVAGAAGAAAGAAAAIALLNMFPSVGAESFTLVAPCDKDDQGAPEAFTVSFPLQSFSDRMLSWNVASARLLQQHLDWRTPTCRGSNELEGQWVTTRWISDEKMVDSSRRLRKLFRYRTQSTRDLGQLSAYWEQFTWRAGPICVRHTGAWWGDPQVWAESAEEGKRVIRHAATEAGIDPDQVGEWAVSSSRSPRYGMPGTMRVLQEAGFPWVASRDGANWPNMLAKRRDP